MVPSVAHVLSNIALRTAVIYAVVLVGVRLSGKREVGQMTPFDLTLLLLNYFVADLSGINRRFRKFIQGQPTLLVHDGTIIESHMAKEHVSMDELQRALREHGISTYHDVALAVLEVDGSISCLKYDEIKPDAHTHLVRRRFLRKKE